jgi:hypothetical protein
MLETTTTHESRVLKKLGMSPISMLDVQNNCIRLRARLIIPEQSWIDEDWVDLFLHW